MKKGRFSHQNLVATGVISGGEWSETLPLANLQDETRFVSAPARQLFPADPTKARIEVAFESPRLLNLVGVMFHTMTIGAEYRLTVAAADGALAAPELETDWMPVHGRMFHSRALEWESPNWWTGLALPADLDLYRRHLWISIEPGIRASAIRIEFRDEEADWFDVGGLWACGAWSPAFNFDHGRELGMDARSLADEAPSGRMLHEARPSRRKLSVSWGMLADFEQDRIFDAAASCGVHRPVILLPDLDNQPGLIREAFPATFEKPPSTRRGRPWTGQLSATFKEIIA